jgi:DNA polymerase IV
LLIVRLVIAHFDLDAFFVSVEILNDPSLKGKPLIVGGSRERGVVTTCSYEARKFGVRSAIPMAKALQLCPQAIVLPGSRGEYSRYSRWVTDIIAAKAPVFEKASIDEFYIDLSGMEKYHKPYEWTIALREEIMEKTGLPISFGIATSKMVAKIATDEAKPNGYLVIPPGKEAEFLGPLKMSKIPGVGEQTYRTLQEMGVELIRDIFNVPPTYLEQRLGKYGLELIQKAQGISSSQLHSYHEAKSVSTENTFHENTGDIEFLMRELVRMTEKVAHELREDNLMAGVIAVKIRYPNFETTSRQTTIPYTFYDDELIPIAKDLFQKLYRPGEKVRLMGVRLAELTNEAVQTNLFTDKQKKADLYKAIDGVKDRFGRNSLGKAGGKK